MWVRARKGPDEGKALRLAVFRGRCGQLMSAIEIIEQIKALPRNERRLVDEFVKSSTASAESAAEESGTDDSSFDVLVDRVFDKHANLLQRLAQ